MSDRTPGGPEASGDISGLADRVVQACRRTKVTLATAESVTAGLVAATLAGVPGCSHVLRGGVIAYATQVKASVLGLPAGALEHVVSEDVARLMAQSAANMLEATIGVATTGVAGPDWLDDQPPGTAWVAVHHREDSRRTATRLLQATGDREEVRAAVVRACLELIEWAVAAGGTPDQR